MDVTINPGQNQVQFIGSTYLISSHGEATLGVIAVETACGRERVEKTTLSDRLGKAWHIEIASQQICDLDLDHLEHALPVLHALVSGEICDREHGSQI